VQGTGVRAQNPGSSTPAGGWHSLFTQVQPLRQSAAVTQGRGAWSQVAGSYAPSGVWHTPPPQVQAGLRQSRSERHSGQRLAWQHSGPSQGSSGTQAQPSRQLHPGGQVAAHEG